MRQISLVLFGIGILFYSFVSYAQEKCVFAMDLIRHGDRTPLKTLPADSHQWQEGLGQLTAKGMQQEYELGIKFRKKYIDDLHLLPDVYQNDTIYVRSTDLDRTLMSAQSLLLGLYPKGTGPNGFQPIPIHTVEATDQDVVLVDTHGSLFQSLLHKHIQTDAKWKAKHNALKNKFQHWSKASGIEITDLHHVQSLANVLHIYQMNQIPYPAGLSTEDVDQIIDAGHWVFTFTFKPKEIGRGIGNPLLQTMLDYVHRASSNESSLKYVLLSGHDSSILALMSALEVPLDVPPPYASQVNITLYETSPSEHKVVISYNDKPVHIPACNGTACTIGQLKSLLASSEEDIHSDFKTKT